MATLQVGIEAAFVTWELRSGTANQILPADIITASKLASATVLAYLGTAADLDTDELAVAIGFMEALLWLGMHASLKISAGDKEWITEMKVRRDDEIARRKQAEWKPYQKTRDRPATNFTNTDLFPYS
ncbi:MAG: hypothetical protein BMS9Abin32_158 [Gammaproteobacteria bacterium]|nr:MAG: hypothetical protein BMS9Abin32_158 [Gammaproteobacteria bacterium]